MTALAQKTTRDLRWHNRSDLLSRLYLRPSASRYQLARESGLSPASVSNVVSDLIGDGLVVENGSESSTGGRPRSLLRVRPEFGHVVGVDIAETHVRVGLFDWTLALIADEVRPFPAEHPAPEEVARLVVDVIGEVVSAAGGDVLGGDLLGVGVGVPGVVQADRLVPGGTVVRAPTLGWTAVPLAGMLSEGLGFPVDIDNGAMALGQAETWRGAGRGAERAVTLLLGIGAGGALSMAAGPGERARSFTVEWGHTVVEVDGQQCRCGAQGCLETHIGAEAILARYHASDGSTLLSGHTAEQQLAELIDRAARDEKAAVQSLDRAATYIGIGISNLINLVTPDRVILSGWASALLGPPLLPAIRANAQRHMLPYLQGGTRIELGELGPTATALGAATLPVARLLASGGHRLGRGAGR